MRRTLLLLCALVGITLLLPDAALAHGLAGRQDLPIPKWLFGWAATVVLVASFVGLAVLWPKPKLEKPVENRLANVPKVLDPIMGAIGVAIFVLVVYAGFDGAQSVDSNITPVFVFVYFWIALAVLALLCGDVFMALNPWRAFGRGVAWCASRISKDGLPDPLPYPERLGRWPAAVGIWAFAWVELCYNSKDDPSVLATLALAYAAVQLVGMSVYGTEQWTRNGDAFGVYFSIFAKLSPLRWERGAVFTRLPLSGVSTLVAVPGTVALLIVMIGSTSFDGLSAGPLWTDNASHITNFFRDTVGLSGPTALEATFTVGLLLMPLIVAGFYQLGVRGMRWAGEKRSATELAGAFAHSLVPIALAYVIAHYFSLLVGRGQAIGYLVSDPLGHGTNYFGTKNATIDYGFPSPNAVWYVQVAALVLGHVAGLILAHDRALTMFKGTRAATRSQYWMLAVMIGFTSLGLWLLSSANS